MSNNKSSQEAKISILMLTIIVPSLTLTIWPYETWKYICNISLSIIAGFVISFTISSFFASVYGIKTASDGSIRNNGRFTKKSYNTIHKNGTVAFGLFFGVLIVVSGFLQPYSDSLFTSFVESGVVMLSQQLAVFILLGFAGIVLIVALQKNQRKK